MMLVIRFAHAQTDSVGSAIIPGDSTIKPILTTQPIPYSSKVFIEGFIRDVVTQEAISFATVYFEGSSIGARTDEMGYFKLLTSKLPADSLTISSIGYGKKKVNVTGLAFPLFLNETLERSAITMKDMVLKVERNPGLNLMKKVIKNRMLHNYDRLNSYQYEIYNKLELDITNLPKATFTKAPIFKKLNFVEKFMDSVSEEKPFLPLFLAETISDYYYQSKPKKTKEVIQGSRISGYKNESVTKFLGGMYQNLNIYENQIPVFNISFVSPIATNAPSYYRYEITDTQFIQGKRCFQVVFTPKRNGEHTFAGDCWVHDTDYAIQRINMIVTKDQDVNWVNKVTLYQEFSFIQDSIWFLTKDKFFVDFISPYGEKQAGFFGRKTTTYKNILFDHASIRSRFEERSNPDVTEINEEATQRDESFWNTVRHDTLSKTEKQIYHMIDTIQSLPVYKKYYNLFYLLGTGLITAGPIEIGSVYGFYSRNIIEGHRFKFAIGTTPKMSKNKYARGYIAYGTRDDRWKYYGSLLWIMRKNPRRYLFGEIKHDIDNTTGVYDDAKSFDNIFNSLGRKNNVPWKLAFVDKQRIEFYNSYRYGISLQWFAERRIFTPYDPLPSDAVFQAQQTRSTEVGVDIRWAYREEFVEGNYYRTSLGTAYPIVHLVVAQGIQKPTDGNYTYTKIRFSVSDNIKLRTYGSLYYNLFGGKYFGTLPYSLLEVHPGNEFYYYNSRSFNMMYRYEYISDSYLGAIMEHSLGSLFFKYIPGIEKMKVRTFWNAKTIYGGLNSANQTLNLNKGYTFSTLTRSPYVELGTGLENLFKVLRIDCVWRVLPQRKLDASPVSRFGVFGSVKFVF